MCHRFFIAFFLLSIIAGLPFLTWLRLSSLGGEDAPYDASGIVPELPSLPGLPEVPASAKDKFEDLVGQLPWNQE